MKITVITLVLLFLSVQFVSAQQPSKADLEKMMKQAQDQMKKYSGDTTLNKVMKNMQDQQKQINNGMNNSSTNTSGSFLDPSDYSNVDNWKFPAKNTALLSALPKKNFTKTELVSFLNDTYAQLSKKLPAEISTSVQSIAAKYNKNSAGKMGDAAVMGWYTNYREESLLLIIKAAATNPDDGLLLNNCAAILEMGGIEQAAIPILKYLLQFNPGSGMVLNNLGEAYAGLGATDTAMVYLGRCMKTEPENPEACNTAGQIEATKGNTQKAVEYFDKSIKSSYTKTAELKLSKIKKDVMIAPLIKPRVDIPEYFKKFEYKLPPQCTSTGNAVEADAEYAAFRAMLTEQLNLYGGKMGDLGKNTYDQYMQGKSGSPSHILQKDDFMKQPFYGDCSKMAHDTYEEYGKARLDIGKIVDKEYYADLKALTDEYEQKYKKMMDDFDKRCPVGEGISSPNCPTEEEVCNAKNALANAYLPQFAMLTEQWQETNKLVFTKYFDDLVFWHYLSLHPTGDDNFKRQYYVFITDYLGTLSKIAITKAIPPCKAKPITKTANPNTINDMDCPLDIVLPFVVGKMQLNCDKFSLSGGEGVTFGYEKDFKTKQSTLSVGIGVKLELEGKLGPLKGGVSGELGENVFITFDGNNGFSDAGLKNEAKLSAGASIGGVINKEESVSVGSTLGINSGWNFNEGPFKGKAGEIQLNPNVNIYQPKQR